MAFYSTYLGSYVGLYGVSTGFKVLRIETSGCWGGRTEVSAEHNTFFGAALS